MNHHPFALLGPLLLVAAGASAATSPRRAGRIHSAEAAVFYDAGVDQYAHGRFPQALASFREAVRLDPADRTARIAANRVREELAMTATEGREGGPQAPPANWSLPPMERGGSFLSVLAGLFSIERTVGDERNREGRLLAMRGRIAQLESEKEIARAYGRKFKKDAELHALSRRLS